MDEILICKHKEFCELFYNGSTIIFNYSESPSVEFMSDKEIIEYYKSSFDEGR